MPHSHASRPETATAEYWATALDAHGVQFVVLDTRSDRELLRLLRSQTGWTVDFDDGEAVILARAESPQGGAPS